MATPDPKTVKLRTTAHHQCRARQDEMSSWRIASLGVRAFSSSRRLANHYETLGLTPNATGPEIKKSFIALSKKHHPDHNQSDPTASTRFVAISEAYATLGSAEQRAKYDRTISVASRSRTTSGSYSSAAGASPAGGRPASGLSRRRTRFQGPPPSFYRSGGWGEQSAKRTEYQAGTRDDLGSQRDGWKGTSGRDYDVPHFDRDGHFRTQETVQARWKSRVREEKQPEEDESGSPVVSFLLVGGALSLIVWTSGILRAAAQAS